MEKSSKLVVFNICVLGPLISIIDVIKPKSVLAAISAKVSKDFVVFNTVAFELVNEL